MKTIVSEKEMLCNEVTDEYYQNIRNEITKIIGDEKIRIVEKLPGFVLVVKKFHEGLIEKSEFINSVQNAYDFLITCNSKIDYELLDNCDEYKVAVDLIPCKDNFIEVFSDDIIKKLFDVLDQIIAKDRIFDDEEYIELYTSLLCEYKSIRNNVVIFRNIESIIHMNVSTIMFAIDNIGILDGHILDEDLMKFLKCVEMTGSSWFFKSHEINDFSSEDLKYLILLMNRYVSSDDYEIGTLLFTEIAKKDLISLWKKYERNIVEYYIDFVIKRFGYTKKDIKMELLGLIQLDISTEGFEEEFAEYELRRKIKTKKKKPV